MTYSLSSPGATDTVGRFFPAFAFINSCKMQTKVVGAEPRRKPEPLPRAFASERADLLKYPGVPADQGEQQCSIRHGITFSTLSFIPFSSSVWPSSFWRCLFIFRNSRRIVNQPLSLSPAYLSNLRSWIGCQNLLFTKLPGTSVRRVVGYEEGQIAPLLNLELHMHGRLEQARVTLHKF